jgi:hypothetical protein
MLLNGPEYRNGKDFFTPEDIAIEWLRLLHTEASKVHNLLSGIFTYA